MSFSFLSKGDNDCSDDGGGGGEGDVVSTVPVAVKLAVVVVVVVAIDGANDKESSCMVGNTISSFKIGRLVVARFRDDP